MTLEEYRVFHRDEVEENLEKSNERCAQVIAELNLSQQESPVRNSGSETVK